MVARTSGSTRTTRLHFELLEDRSVPATLSTSPFESIDWKFGDTAKLGTLLTQIHVQFEQAMEESGTFDLENSEFAEVAMVSGNRVGIQAATLTNLESLRRELVPLEFEETNAVDQVVAGWLPAEALDELAALPTLRFARFVSRPVYDVGLVTSEGDAAMNGPSARAIPPGLNGAGVTVGVISDSYDALSAFTGGVLANAPADVMAGDLPGTGNPNGFTTPVTVLMDDPFGSDEGRAMLQIVHDVAPGASLAFHSAFNNPGVLDQSIATAITNLAAAGSNVIVDDVGFLVAPFLQDSFAAQAVDRVVSQGVSYFSAAGNSDRVGYESDFRSSGVTGSLFGQIVDLFKSGTIAAIASGPAHDFDPGPSIATFQRVRVPLGATVRLTLEWDDPYFSTSPGSGGARSDLDFFVIPLTVLAAPGISFTPFGFLPTFSVDPNIGADPFEFIVFTNDGFFGTEEFGIVVTHFAGPAPTFIKYLGVGNLTIDEFDSRSGTLFGHPNARGAEAVGAVDHQLTPVAGVSPPIIEDFSSAGPSPIFFDQFGRRLAEPEIRRQPRIAAPDGVSTTVPGFDPFFGTSAAAPHAAAVAALMRQASPGASPATIYAALETTAIDMDDPATVGFDLGYDFGTGFGFIQADRAVTALTIPANEIIFVDVSDSMTADYGDVNFDGRFNVLDDLNGDGFAGTMLDGVIARILDDERLMSSNVVVGIFGRQAELLDLSPAPGFQLTATRIADNDGDGIPDFREVLTSLRIGTAGPFTTAVVDPSMSLYEPALTSIRSAVASLTGTTIATIYSDGAGSLPDPSVRNPLAGFPIRVDVEILGPYQRIRSTLHLNRIATTTGGSIRSQIALLPIDTGTSSSAGGSTSAAGSVSSTRATHSSVTNATTDSGSVRSVTLAPRSASTGDDASSATTDRSRDHRSTGSGSTGNALSPQAIDELMAEEEQVEPPAA